MTDFDLEKARKILTNNGMNTVACYAFDQIARVKNGEEYIKKLFLGIDTGDIKYNTPELLAALWVQSGSTVGGVLYALQWQPKDTGPNGGHV